VQNFVARSIYRFSARRRNPSLEGEIRRVCDTEYLSDTRLEAVQLERLVAFLSFAERYSPFYRETFRRVGFEAKAVTRLSDLRHLPVIDKQTLVLENGRIHSQYSFSRVFKAETSGTSGIALQFFKDELWDSTVRAHLARAYARFGVHPADSNAYLWGYNLKEAEYLKVRLLDALQNRRRLFRLDNASVEAFVRSVSGVSYVGGYSSMVYEIAKVVGRLGIEFPNLRMLKGTSEMILDVYQHEAVRAFGRRMVSEYGAAEAGLIAFECEKGSLHVNTEDVVLELEDDGSVVVTNVASRSFPIIRYRLGDVASISSSRCACGRAHPVISDIQGRRGALVVGRNATYPALTFYYVFKNIALEHGILLNYRAVQSVPFEVQVSIEDETSAKYERLVREQLQRYFGEDVVVRLDFVREFPRERRKAQYFESRITMKS
jgi:phenylacetate-CoA ligase